MSQSSLSSVPMSVPRSLARWSALLATVALAACGGGREEPSSAAAPQSLEAARPADPLGRQPLASLKRTRLPAQPMLDAGRVNLLGDPGFEDAASAWSSTTGTVVSDNNTYSGSKHVWLGGYNHAMDRVSQVFTIPAAATDATLRYLIGITTNETLAEAYDAMAVSLHDASTGDHVATLAFYTNLHANNEWARTAAIPMGAYAGRTLELRFTASTDGSLHSSFLIDDVELSVAKAAASAVVLPGTLSQYRITPTAEGLSIVPAAAGGTARTVRPGERVHFADTSVVLDPDGTPGQVYRLYRAAFSRKPDESGLGFQIAAVEESNLALSQVSDNFINSPEFASRYGSLSHTQFVTQLYANVLNRTPDAAGLAYHVGRLAGGIASRRDVLIGFSESQENKNAVAADIATGIAYRPLRPVTASGSTGTPTGSCAPSGTTGRTTTACAPAAPVCGSNQVLTNGACTTVATPTCEAPKVLQSGVCVAVQTTCEAPKVLQGGLCVTPAPRPTVPPPPTCAATEVLQGRVCEPRKFCYTLEDYAGRVPHGVTVRLGEAFSYVGCGAGVNKFCTGTAEQALEGARNNYLWHYGSPQTCGDPIPALQGSIALVSVQVGRYSGTNGNDYLFYPDDRLQSFYPVLRNSTTETLDLKVCVGQRSGYGIEPVYSEDTGCTVVDKVAPGQEARFQNRVAYPLGRFRVYHRRAQVFNLRQQWVQAGEYDARDHGFVPPVEDRGGTGTNPCGGAIARPDCGTVKPPAPPPPPPPPTPTTPTSPSPPPSSGGTGTTPDADGCWVPVRTPPLCVQATPSWSGTEFRVRYTNNCKARVYIVFSNERKDGSWDIGADGISAGSSTSWWTYSGTGRYEFTFTGATKASFDWVCGSRDKAFSEIREIMRNR